VSDPLVWEEAGHWSDWLQRLLTLRDHNSRVVILGTALLGCAAGLVGSFTLLRKRTLVGDAISHAMLPGLGLAYLLVTLAGGDGKSLGWLALGAAVSGLVGAATILLIRQATRLSEDAALGIVLSVFFGAGVALIGVIQSLESGHAAGLEGFIYGKAAALSWGDVMSIAAVAVVCLIMGMLLFKEWTLLCFDPAFSEAEGYRRWVLDGLLMAMVVLIAIVGMQAVGLILVIALLVIPAAAARFWTDRMSRQVGLAAGLGAAGCFLGATLSAVLPELPAGAVIILVSAVFFLISMIGGAQRGLLIRWYRRWQWQRTMQWQHVLRAIYERLETSGHAPAHWHAAAEVDFAHLLPMRSWTSASLNATLNRLQRSGMLFRVGDSVSLSKPGFVQAERLTHQHRLWELYLITQADAAANQVDRQADDIEHVLDPAMIRELEELLRADASARPPSSPHELGNAQSAAMRSAVDEGPDDDRSQTGTPGNSPSYEPQPSDRSESAGPIGPLSPSDERPQEPS